MSNLSAIEKALKSQYDQIYNPQISASNASYDAQIAANTKNYQQQLANLKGQYENTLKQENQYLEGIPSQYQGARESAYLNYLKAQQSVPDVIANMGYSGDSGLSYSTQQANNATWQKSTDTANRAQDSATLAQRNKTDTLGLNYNNNYDTLNSQLASSASTLNASKSEAARKLQAQESAALLSAAQSQQQAEAEAAAKVQAARIAAAAKVSAAKYSASRSSSSSSSRSRKKPDLYTLVTRARNLTKANGSKGTMDVYENLGNLLDYYGYNDEASQNKAYTMAGYYKALPSSVSSVKNELASRASTYYENKMYGASSGRLASLNKQSLDYLKSAYNNGLLGVGTDADNNYATLRRQYIK